ncbi:MAG: HNH endonuclease [Deltaproteobacteria bacterium]|nr:HNH endonuclease [Deltaproteobacteria bacterium]
MLRDGSRDVGYEEQSMVTLVRAAPTGAQQLDWREVHGHLHANARRRAALDANEAFWLREAERLQIWKPLGMVSILDYMERVLGYAPRTAQDRLRVARALAHLPVLTESLGELDGLTFSAVRELVRVATPETEAVWLEAATGKNQRELEELVAGHALGDHPDDPADPEIRSHDVRYKLSPATFALLRQATLALDEEHGRHLDEDELIAALCNAALEGAAEGEPTGRAKFQIAVVVCERCDQGWQEGAGVQVPIDAGTVERARCDAQHLGSLDGDRPARAYQDIPPAVARFVWRRDHGRCQTPGCRSARGLEIHHVIARTNGGTHDPWNLTLRCSACHAAHHAGKLTIRGTAPDQLETVRCHDHLAPVGPIVSNRTPVGAMRLDDAVVRTQARDALVGLGWKPGIARAAVDEACAHVGARSEIAMVIREALRRCPKPAS